MKKEDIEYLLNDYFAQLSIQLPKCSEDKQIEALETIRLMILEPQKIQYARPQTEVLADIKDAIVNGGRAKAFFTTAFSNWYRSGSTTRTYLHDYVNLDLKNRHLFMEMICLRDSGRFDDEELFQFEQYCLDKMGA